MYFRLSVVVYYDDAFHERFGTTTKTRAAAIMALVEEQYSESSFKTKLNLVTKDIKHAQGYNWGTSLHQCPDRYLYTIYVHIFYKHI